MLLNKIANSGFEEGILFPWVTANGFVTSIYSHTGFFSFQLPSGVGSTLTQQVEVLAGDQFELFLSLAKTSDLPSPEVNVTMQYYNAAGTLIDRHLM